MPQIIHPKVTGTVNIEMKIEEAAIFIKAMNTILEYPSHIWIDKTIRSDVSGDTCNQFLQALKKAVEG